MKKSEMNAFVTRHKVEINSRSDGLDENANNHNRKQLKSAIHQFRQRYKKKVSRKGTLLDLQPAVKTAVVMTSLADEILFIVDTGTKRLVKVRVEKAVPLVEFS